MKRFIVFAALLALGCSPADKEPRTLQGNVDLADVPALLAALESRVDSGIDAEELTALTSSVSMDEEKQAKVDVRLDGESTTLVYHVWREQAGWVHLYLSTPSEPLARLIESELERHARDEV